MMCTAAILAGGRARRLGGRDKSALAVGARSILDRQIAVLREVADPVLLVGGPARESGGGVRAVPDRYPGCGPLGGLFTALEAADTPQVLVVACDLPFLTAPFLRMLIEAGRDVDVALVRTHDGYHPLCASYARSCAAPIRRHLDAGRLKVIDLLEEVRVRAITPQEVARYGREEMLLFNINTPDDYVRAGELAGRAVDAITSEPPAPRARAGRPAPQTNA